MLARRPALPTPHAPTPSPSPSPSPTPNPHPSHRTLSAAESLATEYVPLLRPMLARLHCAPYAGAQRPLPLPISAAQWQSVSEMTTYLP